MRKYHLFEVFGVELEYMIVDRTTLRAMPIADALIKEMTGDFTSDVDRGAIAWSNELVAHVIELKTNGPAAKLEGLSDLFAEEVRFINSLLEPRGAMLMPTGAHPFFRPEQETVIWPHEYNEVYALYDRIFDCKGHGWSNLQSTHINLPFAGDAEFGALHAAVRIILPIIPALAASTPIIEGKTTGFFDTRMDYYRRNQQKIPVIGGLCVPEPVFTEEAYHKEIFAPITQAIAPYDEDSVLDKYFLNSRGAIARFDRSAIEIRVMDIQECPRADLALVEFVVLATQWLMERFSAQPEVIRGAVATRDLADILMNAARFGSLCETDHQAYLGLFNLSGKATLRTLWQAVFDAVGDRLSDDAFSIVKILLREGNLSERMMRRVSEDPSADGVRSLYRDLSLCLAENRPFLP